MIGAGAAYPTPLAKYEEVVANPQLFLSTLQKLHASMGTKFMVPVIGGRNLDLHKLFLEVTSRGGIDKILREKKWKDVTATFNFPSTATNASYILRKYYASLLQHYEQIYYFKGQGWNPSPTTTSALRSTNTTPVLVAVHGAPTPVQVAAAVQQARINPTEFTSGAAASASAVGSAVIGVIDGKFESGYLVTVTIGKEKLRGVLYQAPPSNQASAFPTGTTTNTTASPGLHQKSRRRRRRRRCEIKRRDPAHPKPNRSGYNFFFAEQHARLKPLHPGKDREISRMIGELWNKLKDDERSVYQDKAVKDKERYRMEMENYRREKLRGNQVISDAVPIQQRFPDLDEVDMVEVDVKDGRDSPEEEDVSDSGDISEGSEEDDENFTETHTSPRPPEDIIMVGEGNAKGEVEVKAADEKEKSEAATADGFHTSPPAPLSPTSHAPAQLLNTPTII